ncbi:Na+/H+ antiporter NhaA [Catenovulum sp. SM1970]|uniref:Na+/H+ antiporter NhaA n=1 Tax=Marinifaba aquimaris TaxID=2741323 RepID=UPI0015729A94|nr:Na+/H+ antiporter NhaA [Marinifaba aquimaris]NTS75496.1 Na+/H+ antiporter NhaA [Marinifaba aquimaris]
MITNKIIQFFHSKSAGGILLFVAALLAMLAANSGISIYYQSLIDLPVAIQIGVFEIAKPLLLWINDGLMAIFFFLVGLELKREVLEGELNNFKAVAFPALGAFGGMVAPALIFLMLNGGDPIAIKGWAIPAATDIAFALGILTLFGSRVPLSVKIFLVSLAIFDDIGAIIIIALFYTTKISATALIIAAVCLLLLFILNRSRCMHITAYILIGVVMWTAVLKSGVHATLAGVALAMFIPMRDTENNNNSPLISLEHDLHSVVALLVLPLFAFANSGINLEGVGIDDLLHSVPLGIAAGLVIGKQLGVFGLCFVTVKLRLIKLPEGMTLPILYGISLLCGIGFTMSMFIGSLAFEAAGDAAQFDERIGIILGSLVSGIAGYLVLNKALPEEKPETN